MRGLAAKIQIVSASLSRHPVHPGCDRPTCVKPRGTLGRMTMLSWLLVPLALALALWPLGHPSAQSRVETVVSGLEVPWALAFAPDGTLYVTERPGLIRVVKNGRLDPKAVPPLPVPPPA